MARKKVYSCTSSVMAGGMASQGAQGGGANPMMQMMSGMMMGGAMMGAGHEDDSVSRAWWARDVSCHCILATISNGSSVKLPRTATQDLFSNYWKEVWQWDAKATARWVGIIEGLEEYAELFLMNQINGLKLLAMDGMVMMQIGVTQMGARAKLLDEINHLSGFPTVAQPTRVTVAPIMKPLVLCACRKVRRIEAHAPLLHWRGLAPQTRFRWSMGRYRW